MGFKKVDLGDDGLLWHVQASYDQLQQALVGYGLLLAYLAWLCLAMACCSADCG